MRFAPFVALGVLIVHPAIATAKQPLPKVTESGLVQVPSARVHLAYIRPGADFSKYRSIELGTLQIPLSVRDAAPNGSSSRFRESYVLRDKDVAALQDDYARAMHDELGKAGYRFVTSQGPDTLVVAAQVIRIRLNAPIESTRMSYSGSGRTYSRGAGTIAVAAVLADGATGQVLAQVADQSYSTNVWGINNSVANRGEARRAFRKWASALRQRLGESRISYAKSSTQD